MLGEELKKVSGMPGAARARHDEAAWLLDQLVSSDEFVEFLTAPAYEIVTAMVGKEQVAA